MNYHNITKMDMANGEGCRVVLWVSGCSHACKGCHNPQTWNPKSGVPFDEEAIREIEDELSKDVVNGITISGGDSLYPENRETVMNLMERVVSKFPNKSIWLYTGYKWEEIKDLKGIILVDVLIDGKYEECLSKPSPEWRGSTNQRIINVKSSLIEDEVVLYK